MSTKKLVVKVTQKHIDTGLRGRCWLCPIAFALKDLTGKNWRVHNDAVYYEDLEIPLPWSAISFIKCFDEGLRVEPFEFELEY